MKPEFSVIGFTNNINEFIQKLPLPVVIINVNKEIIAFNRAFFLMAGREVRQGTHYCYEFLNFPFCHTNCLADMATKLGRTINWDESHGQRKNGEELIVRPMVTPLFDEVGERQGYVLLFQDTTDEVQLYRNFRSNLDHLERKVSFLQTLNDAAEEFRKITQIDKLMNKITKFLVEHLAIECCQLIENQDEEFIAVSTSRALGEPLTQLQEKQLVELMTPSIKNLKKDLQSYHIQQFKNVEIINLDLRESVLLPIQSGTHDYGYLAIYQFGEGEPLSQERLEYLDLFAKSIGPYIENSHIIANLESIVEERTQELRAAQSALMESTRLASVGETAGMVAHEVLNPMTAVLARLQKIQGDEGSLDMIKLIVDGWETDYQAGGFAQLSNTLQELSEEGNTPLIEEDFLNLQDCTEDISKDLKFIDEQLNRIVGIIDNLRGLSRAKTTKTMIEIRQSIQKTEELTRDGFIKRRIKLEVKYDHESEILFDTNELVQVLHNLTRNAMQAIERNGWIEINTSETEDRVEIRIVDSGPGVPLEVAPKIFEMRFTTKSADEGTGLGLNLSRRLVRQAQGDVLLEDAGGNGKGATFLIWFPKPKKK